MTLAEFLLARIAEDEADARAAVDDYPEWRFDGTGLEQVSHTGTTTAFLQIERRPNAGAHIARWDPARVLAECEAKRRIVAVHTHPQSTHLECVELRALAAVYAPHPDYRAEWAG